MRRAVVGGLLILAGGLCALVVAWRVAPPVVLGFALAAVLERPTERVMQGFGVPRWLAAAVLLLGGATLLGGFGLWAGAQLVHELLLVRGHAPEMVRSVRRAMDAVIGRIGVGTVARLLGLAQDQRGTLARAASQVAMHMVRGIGSLPNAMGTLALSLIVAFLALAEGPLGRAFEGLGRTPFGSLVTRTLGEAAQAAWRLVSTELMLASYTAVVSTLLFTVLGAAVPVLLGFVAGLCDLIPYAGPAVLYVPWAIVLLATGQTVHGLWVLAGWAVLVGSRAVFELHWVGRGIGLSPLWVLVSFYVGGRMAGLPGLLLGPVVAAGLWGVLAGAGRGGDPKIPRTEGWTRETRGGDAAWADTAGGRTRARPNADSGGAKGSWSAGARALHGMRGSVWAWPCWARRGRWAVRRSTWYDVIPTVSRWWH